MRWLVSALLLSTALGETSSAARRDFPYTATIEVESAEVRSGAGRNYYVTGQVHRGEQVTVRRHDPGGWYMISPPKGSFSWIRSSHVEKLSQQRGVVTSNDVVVRVGNLAGAYPNSFQRRLSTGDKVTILGEQTFNNNNGRVRMYKIKPPEFEWRWISGRAIRPVGNVANNKPKPIIGNPFADAGHQHATTHQHKPQKSVFDDHKSHHTAHQHGWNQSTKKPQQDGFVERPIVRVFDGRTTRQTITQKGTTPKSAPVERSVPNEQVNSQRERLQQLDDRFREIIKQETDLWDFTELENGYLNLKQQASRPMFVQQIDMRLAAVARYRTIKSKYVDFISLTSKTDQREQRLISLQEQKDQPPRMIGPPGRTYVRPQPTTNVPPTRRRTGAHPHYPPHGRTHHGAARVRQFDGAGIVRRAASTHPGAPRHVLTAPNGRILAYLQPTRGVPLDRYLGQSMGIYGRRWHRQDLQTDMIAVQGLRPVQLQR